MTFSEAADVTGVIMILLATILLLISICILTIYSFFESEKTLRLLGVFLSACAGCAVLGGHNLNTDAKY